jgi:uncharacterized protein
MKRSKRSGWWSAVALCLAIALPGCGTTSTPARFHSLVAPPDDAAARATRSAPDLRVELMPVTLPAQVDVPQIVVRLPDDSLRALEHERWIAPLADEIRTALRLRIDAALGAAPAAAAAAPWRVALDVQRFDSALGGAASLQVTWSLQQQGSGALLRCRVTDRQAVADGPVALVAAHRAILERLGDAIARALRSAAAGGVPACG